MLPSISDLFKGIPNLGLPSVSDIFSGAKSAASKVATTVSDIFKPVASVLGDPVKVVQDVNRITNEVSKGIGTAVNNIWGQNGVFGSVGALIDNTVGKVSSSVNKTIDSVGKNPIVAGTALLGSGSLLALGIAGVIVAATIARKV